MIVGLGHQARTGKDTAAAHLVERYGFVRIALADALREALYLLNPIVGCEALNPVRLARVQDVVDEVGWEQAKLQWDEVRELLQRLGTDAGQKVLGPMVWTDALFRKFEDGRDYVVPDVRFPHEADAIKAAGGIVLKIVRPGVGAVNGHRSETALLDWGGWDAVIVNSASIEALGSAVAKAVGL